jgi:HK97 family phage prohead protease
MNPGTLPFIPFTFPLEVLKQIELDGGFHVVGYAATTDFDMQGDIITEDALQNASLDLIKNSTVLLNHDMTKPIGKVTKVEFDKHGLLIDALISSTEPEIIQKIKEGVLNKFSIRGQVLEREKKYMRDYDRIVNVIRKIALVEVSLVSVPANPEARAIGWYLSKALEEVPADPADAQGGKPMSDEQVVVEEISPDTALPVKGKEEAPIPPAPDPETPATDPNAPAPEEQPAPAAVAPAAAPVAQKDLYGPWPMMMQPVFFLLDKLIGMNGDAAVIGQQIKAILTGILGNVPLPATAAPTSKAASPEDIGKMVAAEVKKQVDAALQAVPAMRKGFITQDHEAQDAKKTFDGLPPEKKLKVALAMQQA